MNANLTMNRCSGGRGLPVLLPAAIVILWVDAQLFFATYDSGSAKFLTAGDLPLQLSTMCPTCR